MDTGLLILTLAGCLFTLLIVERICSCLEKRAMYKALGYLSMRMDKAGMTFEDSLEFLQTLGKKFKNADKKMEDGE